MAENTDTLFNSVYLDLIDVTLWSLSESLYAQIRFYVLLCFEMRSMSLREQEKFVFSFSAYYNT